MEITVSMLITAIVVTVTFTAYRIISSNYEHFTRQGEAFGMLIRLDEWLRRDFSQAEIVSQTHDGLKILKEGGQVSYRFFPGEVIRDGVVSDTFQLAVTSWSGFFEGLAVASFIDEENPEIELQDMTATEAARIDQLDLTIRFRKQQLPYSYYKVYSSHNLMKRKTNAID